ncbi:MAG TPA: Grx4 family monothiol glutaredoxin [Polyangiaceae bacterium]|nr:Grx4 family monothiol glutaredoxin [Polyangiaceae bacterium]
MLSDALRSRISGLIAQNPVIVFMKGTRRAPQCGFSAQVVQILDELVPEYESVDVLGSAELREGIKEFSQWPTIPQLFINGEFIGGCDIVRALRESGELEQLLSKPGNPPPLPKIRVSAAAAQAFRAALAESTGADAEVLHLKIDARWQNDLYFAPREPGTLELELGDRGLSLFMDPASLRRADGLSIDFLDGANAGFKIENPNQPPSVKQLSPQELKGLLDKREITVFDVRPDHERALASIPEAHSLDQAGQDYLFSLDRDAPIAFLCHHGMRSQSAAEQVLAEGFRNVYNVRGGIHAWSETVDRNVPKY